MLEKCARVLFRRVYTSSVICSKSSSQSTQRVLFTLLQATGMPHIGNYLGSIHHFFSLVQSEHKACTDAKHPTRFLIGLADLHSLTALPQPKQLSANIEAMAASILASIEQLPSPLRDQVILFQQSSVSGHTELAWILACICTMGRLEHLPSWREKATLLGYKAYETSTLPQTKTKEEGKEASKSDSKKPTTNPLALDGVNSGLFFYPVLQAADILLYRGTHVPVGEDQLKHLELARDLSRLFNSRFCSRSKQLFPPPEAVLCSNQNSRRVQSLRSPTQKMSKSDPDARSRIELTDSSDSIRSKIRKAITDGDSRITYSPETRPGISNLIDLICAFSPPDASTTAPLTPELVVSECARRGLDTVGLKDWCASAVDGAIRPLRERIRSLLAERSTLAERLASGNAAAQLLANDTMKQVRQLTGLIARK